MTVAINNPIQHTVAAASISPGQKTPSLVHFIQATRSRVATDLVVESYVDAKTLGPGLNRRTRPGRFGESAN